MLRKDHLLHLIKVEVLSEKYVMAVDALLGAQAYYPV